MILHQPLRICYVLCNRQCLFCLRSSTWDGIIQIIFEQAALAEHAGYCQIILNAFCRGELCSPAESRIAFPAMLSMLIFACAAHKTMILSDSLVDSRQNGRPKSNSVKVNLYKKPFKSVLRLLQVVKHYVSDVDLTLPETIPPKEAGGLTLSCLSARTPPGEASGEYNKNE